MPKDNQNDTRGLQDVELYFKQIQAVNKAYKRLVEKLEPIAHDKKKVDEKLELLTERGTLKDQFISKKQACRSNIKALPPQLALLKEKELKDFQEEYREIDNDFKQLGMFYTFCFILCLCYQRSLI
jgi:hypothetical protein